MIAWFRNLKTVAKLIVSFAVMAIIVCVVGVLGISKTRQLNFYIQTIYNDRLVPSIELGHINKEVGNIRMVALKMTSGLFKDKMQELFNNANDSEKKVDNFIKKYGAKALTAEEAKVFDEFKAAWKAFDETRTNTMKWALNGEIEKARANATGDANKKYQVLDEKLEELINSQDKAGKDLFNKSGEIYKAATSTIIAAIIISLFLSVGAGLFLARVIATPLEKIVGFAQRIAEGDLNVSIDEMSKDEIGILANTFNHMVAKLRELIGGIQDSASQLASAAEELSASSEQMSTGAEEQTSQTDQIATAMEEMSATVQEVAKNSSHVAENAKIASGAASKGSEIVEKTVAGMQKIANQVNDTAQTVITLGKSSEQIGEIIEVIDDIADQTNLLALNAAIEAARAGEQGRGFAVVADEVRKLAERTTKATKEIASMIKKIQHDTNGAVSSMEAGTHEVEVGVKLAGEAGGALKEIVSVVDKVTDMIQQIATAAEEQGSASEQISTNVESIATTSKHTAQGAQQCSSASQEIASLAVELQKLVGEFKINTEVQGEDVDEKNIKSANNIINGRKLFKKAA